MKGATKAALREIAKVHKGDLRLTPNQHLIIASVAPVDRPGIDALLKEHGLDNAHRVTALGLNAMACVALPTCGLALAESERYLPDLVTQLEAELEAAGLRDDAIVIRMTGCPNGCGRPFLAEIGFVGKAPGKYNMYLGAAFNGSRLNTLYKPSVAADDIVTLVRPLFQRYAKERLTGERFGDFVIRAGIVRPSGGPRISTISPRWEFLRSSDGGIGPPSGAAPRPAPAKAPKETGRQTLAARSPC